MVGIIYVLLNQAMPGLIKIGRTAENIETRMRQLDTSGVPLPFECFYAAEVSDPDRVTELEEIASSLNYRQISQKSSLS
jgi:hypothetical protein